MKKLVLTTLTFTVLFVSDIFAQDVIPNHSFEQWDGDPVSWINPLSAFGIQNVVQSSDAQEGSLSAKLFVVWDDNTSSWLPATLNSLLIPVTAQHASLHGYYKGTSVEGDEFLVNVLLYTDGGMIAGTGSFETSLSVSEWTAFSVPITYLGEAPDEAYIYLAIAGEGSDPHEGTEFYVDNLTWDASSDIADLTFLSDVTSSPNPANDRVNVEFTLEQPDRFTFELIQPHGSVQIIASGQAFQAGSNAFLIDIQGIPAGIYILKATGDRYSFVEKIVVSR